MDINACVSSLVNALNLKYADLGRFDIPTNDPVWASYYSEDEGVKPGDIVIAFDYCTDDIRHTDKEKQFCNWISQMHGVVTTVMLVHGYRNVNDHDGSGGGLYYGHTVFRKI